MKRSAYRGVAVLLALVMALAPVAFVVPAASMDLQLSMSSDGDCGRCDCCPQARPAQVACSLNCANTLPLATEPDRIDTIFFLTYGEHRFADQLVLLNHISSPDPPPPKLSSPH